MGQKLTCISPIDGSVLAEREVQSTEAAKEVVARAKAAQVAPPTPFTVVNERLVSRMAALCAVHKPGEALGGVELSLVVNIFSGSFCSLGPALPACVINVTRVSGSKVNFWQQVCLH